MSSGRNGISSSVGTLLAAAMRERESRVLRDERLIQLLDRLRCNYGYEHAALSRLPRGVEIAFDARDVHVPEIVSEPFEVQRLRSAWTLNVSKRGAFLTCESVSFQPSRWNSSAAEIHHDPQVRPALVQLTEQLAKDLDLTYVDAASLRGWQVNYEDIDPDFYLDRERGLLPTAFQVLFYE